MKDLKLIGMTDIAVLVTNIKDDIAKLQKIEIDLITSAAMIDKYDLKTITIVNPISEAQLANDFRRPLERNLKAIEKRGEESINRSFHRKIIKDFYLYQEMKALKTMEKLSQTLETLIKQEIILSQLKNSFKDTIRQK